MDHSFGDTPSFLEFECFRFDSGLYPDLFPIIPRSHYFSEILLIRSGVCRVTRGKQQHIMNPGELLYIAPLLRHAIESEDGGPVVFDVVKFSATRLREIPSYLSVLRSFFIDAAKARPTVQMSAEDVRTFHMDSIITECISETQRQEFACDLHIRALLYLLITGLARFWLKKKNSLPLDPGTESDPVSAIPAYIEQHISEQLHVEDLARQCSLSYPWFAKRFHERYGLSCKQFIEYLRTEFVEQYLIHTDLDLAEISERTGYTDCSHLVKDFRRMTGITPGRFRTLMNTEGGSPFLRFSALHDPNPQSNPAQRVDTQEKNG